MINLIFFFLKNQPLILPFFLFFYNEDAPYKFIENKNNCFLVIIIILKDASLPARWKKRTDMSSYGNLLTC